MAWLALLLLGQAPDVDRKVSVETLGQSLPTVLSRLSSETGVRCVAVGSLARNTVVARLDYQPLRHVLDQLGAALTCSWRVVDGRVELFRTSAQVEALKKTERELRARQLAESIRLLQLEPFSETLAEGLAARSRTLEPRLRSVTRDASVAAEMKALFDSMPAGRGLIRAVRSLPTPQLLDMKAQDRKVFAFPANPVQSTLPTGKDILSAFNKERTVMFRVLQRDLAREREFVETLDPRASQFRLPSEAVKVIVAVNRGPEFRGFSVNVRFVDADGWPVAEASKTVEDEAKAEIDNLPEAGIVVDDELFRLNEEVSLRLGSRDRKSLLTAISNPQQHEPGSWYQGAALFDYARKANRQLVAALSDRSLRRLWLSSATPGRTLTAKELATRIAREWSLTSSYERGTWMVKPLEQLAAEREYLDRDLMSGAWQSVVSEGRYQISVAATYCAKAKSELIGAFAEGCYVTALTPPYSGNSVDEWLAWGQPNVPILRFVGRVPSQFMSSGRATIVGELPSTAREALDLWILKNAHGGAFGEQRDAEHPYDHITRLEPTEALPRGIPSDTRVRFTWFAAHYVLQRINGYPDALHIAEQAYYLLQSNVEAANFDAKTGRALRVEVLFSDGRQISHVLHETPPGVESTRNWRRVSDLPDEVLNVMRAEARRQEELGRRMGSAGPPP